MFQLLLTKHTRTPHQTTTHHTKTPHPALAHHCHRECPGIAAPTQSACRAAENFCCLRLYTEIHQSLDCPETCRIVGVPRAKLGHWLAEHPPNLIHVRANVRELGWAKHLRCRPAWPATQTVHHNCACISRRPVNAHMCSTASDKLDVTVTTRSRLCSSLSANRLDGRPPTRTALQTQSSAWAARDSFCLTRGLLVSTLTWNSANWVCNLAKSSSVSGSMFTSAVCVFHTRQLCASSILARRFSLLDESLHCVIWTSTSNCWADSLDFFKACFDPPSSGPL